MKNPIRQLCFVAAALAMTLAHQACEIRGPVLARGRVRRRGALTGRWLYPDGRHLKMQSWLGVFAPVGTPRPVMGLLAPAGTPAEVVAFLNKEVLAIMESPAVKGRLAVQGFTPKPMTPQDFRKFIQDETIKFADLIKSNNIVVE